jgi:hypothetical protein
MFSHLRAVLLATGTLLLVGTLHTVSTAPAGAEAAIALVPATGAAPGIQSAQVRSLTGAAIRAIAIGY